MKDYKQLLKELPSNTVVCALGDFDPPTVGHELLVKTVKRLAESKGSAHVIFTSPSKTLQEDKKSQYLKLMFPKTNFTSIEESFASSVEQLKKKYKNVIVVVGTEQSTGLKKALKESVEFVAITEKNPDADTSKMKSFATKALYEEFKKKLPSSIRELDGRRLMNDVRAGMGLEPVKEQLKLVKDTLREQYFRGEIFNEGDIVESNGVQYTIVKRGSNHLLLKEESGELVSKWIQDVKSITEGNIQPSGTDQVVPAGPDKVDAKDQNGNPTPRDKGNKKGFLTFYGYTKDNNDFKVAKMEQYDMHSVSDEDQDSQSDLDAQLQKLQIFDPKEVGHSMTNPLPHKGSHHLRRMKIQRHFKEQLEEAKKKKELPNTDVARNGMDCAGGSGERVTPVSEAKLKSFKQTALDKYRQASVEREKKHNDIESARQASSSENMSGAIDRLEKTLNKESVLNPQDPHGDYKAKVKALQDIQMDPNTHKDPQLKATLIQRKADLDKEYAKVSESLEEAKKKKEEVCPTCGKHECECGEQRPQTSKEMNTAFDPFFKEETDEDLSDSEIDKMINEVTDEEIEELYEESELAIIDEETGEELEAVPEEAQIDLMEVLSRQERMRAKMRFRRTKAKRERSTKIALKRYSDTKTINKRARRLAIKLMKKRLLRGRDLANLSIGEKERIERILAKRKAVVGRIATKLVARVRKVEKSRMSHGTFTKGSLPSVF